MKIANFRPCASICCSVCHWTVFLHCLSILAIYAAGCYNNMWFTSLYKFHRWYWKCKKDSERNRDSSIFTTRGMWKLNSLPALAVFTLLVKLSSELFAPTKNHDIKITKSICPGKWWALLLFCFDALQDTLYIYLLFKILYLFSCLLVCVLLQRVCCCLDLLVMARRSW